MESAFTNGKPIFAASKVGDRQHLHFAENKNARRKTRNFVFKEILLICELVST